jgi:hypothetical protein
MLYYASSEMHDEVGPLSQEGVDSVARCFIIVILECRSRARDT